MTPTWLTILGAIVLIVTSAITAFLAVRSANRETAETIRQLREQRVFEKQRDHAERLTKIEEAHQKCLAERLPQFITRADLINSEAHRDRKFDLVNIKLDKGLEADTRHSEALANIKSQVDTIFALWNKEHAKR